MVSLLIPTANGGRRGGTDMELCGTMTTTRGGDDDTMTMATETMMQVLPRGNADDVYGGSGWQRTVSLPPLDTQLLV